LHDVVARAIERAGVEAPSRGTHILRHSLATRLLREGATLDERSEAWHFTLGDFDFF